VRRPIARLSFLVAALALGWAALIFLTGGFSTRMFGVAIRSHNATRPAWAGAIALVAFVWAYGPARLAASLAAASRASADWMAVRELPYARFAIALAAAVLLFGLLWSTGVAGGSDSYGYVSQAELWLRGVPIVRQPWAADVPWPNAPWTFSPLGYRPSFDGASIVPVYAVGLPLLMAGVKAIAGHSAIFWLTPLAGAALVLATYGIGRRLDSPAAGLVAAWLVATSATLVSEVPSPMSDVIAAAALSASWYALLSASPARASGLPYIAAGGLAAAIAIIVRPNLVPSLAILAAAAAARERGWRRPLAAVLFLTAASPGALIPAWANWRLFGSPFVSGYGEVSTIYAWAHVLPNLRAYPAILLHARAVAILAGFVALAMPSRRLWPHLRDRALHLCIVLFVASIVVQYIAYEPATGEGYLRLLLPCWPFAATAAARVLLSLPRRRWMPAAAVAALLVQGIVSVRWACHDGGCDHRSERKYPGAGEIVRTRTEPDSVIFSDQHSGSIRYYGGRLSLRYDQLDREWLDRAVDWLAARGVHSYLVLDDWEVPKFREHFAGQRRVAQADQPIVTYRGTVVTQVFDLLNPVERRGPRVEWIDRFDGPRFPRPAVVPACPKFAVRCPP
jgi:hypothetical protein